MVLVKDKRAEEQYLEQQSYNTDMAFAGIGKCPYPIVDIAIYKEEVVDKISKCPNMQGPHYLDLCICILDGRICRLETDEPCEEWERIKEEQDG